MSGSGGALYASSSEVALINTQALNCSAKEDGGAVYLFNSTYHSEGNRFIGNQAQRYGGAVRSDGLVNFVSKLDYYGENTLVL